MRVVIFVSSILFVVAGAAALPMSEPASASAAGPASMIAHDAYGR
ncbi:hypothetical protein [Hansschlegelia sp. KR7-227]